VGDSPDSLVDRLQRVVITILAVLVLAIAVLAALADLGETLRRLLEAWRPLWRR